MKKKLTLALTALLMLTLTVFAFTACQISTGGGGGGEPAGDDHTHRCETYSYEWNYDYTQCTATGTCFICSENILLESYWVSTSVEEATCTQPERMLLQAHFYDADDYEHVIEVGEPLGHDYTKVVYTWSYDYTTCTAKCVCSRNNTHAGLIETVYASPSVTQEATCTLDEISAFTATFEDEVFATQTQENVKTADKLGHDYGAPTYVWSKDNSTCTATRVCNHDDSHQETETVNSTSSIAQNKTCTFDELTTYTATFNNNAFATQTQENVKTADKLGHDYTKTVYTWNDDYTECTAKLVCTHNNSHVDVTETAKVQKTVIQDVSCTLDEISAFTATFKNKSFSTQTKESVKTANKLGHDYDLETDICKRCDIVYYTENLQYELVTDGSESYYKVIGIGSAPEVRIVIPSSYNGLPVKSIADNAFKNCTRLTIIVVPDSVTTIGSSAFSGCSSLESITLPFVGASENATGYEAVFGYIFGYTISGSNSVISGTTYQYYDSSSSSSYKYYHYYIPASLTSVTITGDKIPGDVFYNCSGLKSITILDSVTSIGIDAFWDCSGLTSITIPDSVTSIGDGAFYNCPIETATIPTIAIPYIKKDKLKTVVITSGTSIGSSAFRDCSKLTSVTIPNKVTSIGNCAFADCSGLTRINFNGTKSQWNAISKGSDWKYNTGSFTVYCTDGTI